MRDVPAQQRLSSPDLFRRSIARSVAIKGALAMIVACAPLAAEERATMPMGALLCKAIELAIEHARIVRLPTSEGLREFVEARVASGACHMVKSEVAVTVVDVDQRGFALVKDESGQWWTDAENIWGYFETPVRLKAWKKG